MQITVTPACRARLARAADLGEDQLRPYYLTPDGPALVEAHCTPDQLDRLLRTAIRVLVGEHPFHTVEDISRAVRTVRAHRANRVSAHLLPRLLWAD